MGDESDIAELRRRVSPIEQDVVDLRADMAGMRKDLTERVAAVENQLVTLRADLPRIISEAVSAVVREEFAKRK